MFLSSSLLCVLYFIFLPPSVLVGCAEKTSCKGRLPSVSVPMYCGNAVHLVIQFAAGHTARSSEEPESHLRVNDGQNDR